MGLSGMLGSLLQQYAGGSAAATDATHQHFDQVAQAVDHSTLATSIGSMIRSSETPGFGQIAGQMFGNANGDQKATMLNTLLAGAGPAVLSQLSGLIPGLTGGTAITPQQAQAIPPATVTNIAEQAHAQNPSIIDQMSSIYAAHPTLVKTLGTGAMMIALREIGKNFQSK
jgi:hypothetical protein